MESSFWVIERELRVLKQALALKEYENREIQMWRCLFLAKQILPQDQLRFQQLYGKFKHARSEDILAQGPHHWFEVIRSELTAAPDIRPAAPRALD